MRLLSLVILLAMVAMVDGLSAHELARGGEERRPQDHNSHSDGDRHREELNDRDLYNKNRAELERQNDLRRSVDVNVNGAGADCGQPGNPCVVPTYPSDNSQQ